MFKFGDGNKGCICSFCGKSQSQVQRMISGPGVYICSDCITLCSEILADTQEEEAQNGETRLPKPREIKAVLDQYVIGQEKAKKILAVAVYNHYKRINSLNHGGSDKNSEVELQKSNVLVIGPTGCGKTYLAKILAKILQVPIAISDATSLTEAGYVGEDVENILLKLIQAADFDIEKAQKGIIYVDEIDKITRKSENRSITRDVSGEGVQQALLKIVEGTVASVPPQGGRKHPHQECLQIDTENILFICGGAFEGLEEIIEQRVSTQSMGFRANIESRSKRDVGELLAQVLPEDLLKYGLIPEFVGRMPIVVTLNALDEPALVKVLTEPKNALVKQYQRLFCMDDVELVFTKEAVNLIAHEAEERKTGARALRSIIEEAILDVMFDIPSETNVRKCIVTEEVITEKAKPTLIYADEEESGKEKKSGSSSEKGSKKKK